MIGDGDGDGDVFLLAAADMLLVSLLPRSIDRCRKEAWDLDLLGMITFVPTRAVADDVPDMGRSGSTQPY